MAVERIPQPQATLQAWLPFRELIGVTTIRNEADYQRISLMVNALLGEMGEDEAHPLTDVLGFLSDQMEAYEDCHYPIPNAEPSELLRFLMDQHGLKQDDLADCAPQSRISEILGGKRPVSKEIAKRLAQRFHVSAELFL